MKNSIQGLPENNGNVEKSTPLVKPSHHKISVNIAAAAMSILSAVGVADNAYAKPQGRASQEVQEERKMMLENIQEDYEMITAPKPSWQKIKKLLTPQVLDEIKKFDLVGVVDDVLVFGGREELTAMKDYATVREGLAKKKTSLMTEKEFNHLILTQGNAKKHGMMPYRHHTWIESGDSPKEALFWDRKDMQKRSPNFIIPDEFVGNYFVMKRIQISKK